MTGRSAPVQSTRKVGSDSAEEEDDKEDWLSLGTEGPVRHEIYVGVIHKSLSHTWHSVSKLVFYAQSDSTPSVLPDSWEK